MSEDSMVLESPSIGTNVSMSSPTIPTIKSVTKQQIAETTQNPHEHRRHTKTTKSLKLISVGFKELALDSPTFRAYTNHSMAQIDGFQLWIESFITQKKRYNVQHSLFEQSMLLMRELFESPHLSDGLLDSDYTLLDLNFTSAGFNEMQNEVFKFTKPNEEVEKLTNDLIQGGLLEFADTRRKFETIQNRYDLVLSKYGGLSKTREPVSLREDAFQLAEIRNQYIELALDMAVAITDLTQLINIFLIEVVTVLWKTNLDLKIQTKNYNSFSKYVERIHEFMKVSKKSMNNLRNDMIRSKIQTVDTTLKQHVPSKDLNEYNSATINPSTMLDGFEDPSEEKHGWLFMKTSIGKPIRQVWVRRWCFVKDGIFGIFNLSPSKTFVQELDKIGVALCNVRYCPEEDRRFCFEFKTINNTIVFQAETLQQLKAWLHVFQLAKSKVMESNDEFAFERYSPVLKDFACTASTSTDVEMTSLTSSVSMSDLVLRMTLPFDIKFLSTIYNAPICTLLSREAVAAHAIISSTSIPTAITANIWGSVNWGSYHLLDKPVNNSQQDTKQTQQLLSEESFSNRYPSFYPKRLIAFDCQLRSLLGSSFANDEFVLLEFRAIWLPNAKQEMVGRCYVTQNCVYFYMNSLGFVNLLLRPLQEVISFDSISEDHFDILKIYEISGLSMKLKLYLDSGKLIKDQLTALLKNRLSDEPKSISSLIKEIEHLRSVHTKQEIERLRVNYETKKEIIPSVISTSLKMDQPIEIKTNYNQEMKLIWDKVYDIPSKLLFHTLLGDESFILQKILPFIDARNENISMTLWNQNSKQQLVRSFMTDTILDDYEFRTTRINQTVENLINSKYYNILQKTQFFKFPGLNAFRIITRVIIYSLNLKNSKVLIYSKVQFDDREKYQLKFFNFANAHFLNKTTRFKVENLDSDINEAIVKIGSHAKVVKLIRQYGQITKNEQIGDVEDNDEVIFISIPSLIKVILRRFFWNIYGVILFFFKLLFNFFHSLRLNYILVLLLGLSFGYNLLLTGKSGVSYWVVSRADNMINEYTSNDNIMARAIYLKDVEELVDFKYSGTGSKCFDNFKKNSLILNYNSSIDNELKKTVRELGLKRNQLLINLNMINSLEKHLIDAEWNNFISNEIYRCDLISELPIGSSENLDELLDYCSSCHEDMANTHKHAGELLDGVLPS